MTWPLSETMRLIEQATRPLGIVFGAGNIHGWNLQAHFLLRNHGETAPWLEDEWFHACRRTVRTSSEQRIELAGFCFRFSCLNQLNNNGQFLQGSYATEPVLVEILSGPTVTSTDDDLCDRYGLTNSEAAILRALGTGATPAAIALTRRSTLGTIRQHLKNIRRKLGIARMPNLVQFAVQQFGGQTEH
jgi:DNA-binding CsgD family transcriptional regulator